MQQTYRVTGMTCAACSARVEKVTSKLPGVNQSQVNLLAGTMKIDYDEGALGPEEIIRAALEEVDEGKQADKLRKVLEAKARTLAGDPQFRLKLLRFGLARGYDYDAVQAEVSKIIATFAAEK